jgi:hypothetical protein
LFGVCLNPSVMLLLTILIQTDFLSKIFGINVLVNYKNHWISEYSMIFMIRHCSQSLYLYVIEINKQSTRPPEARRQV